VTFVGAEMQAAPGRRRRTRFRCDDAISHELRPPLYERGDIIRCLRAWLQTIEPAEADRFLAGLRLRAAGTASDGRRDGRRDLPRAGAAR